MSAAGPGRPLLVAASLVVGAALAAGLWVLGTPSAQREARMDERRERDLAAIVVQVDRYHVREGRLPADLATVAAQPGLRLAVADPVDAAPYGYTPTGADRYRLCATFATDTARPGAGRRHGPDHDWLHAAGPACFDRVVDPDHAD
jgi:hypothetical protein